MGVEGISHSKSRGPAHSRSAIYGGPRIAAPEAIRYPRRVTSVRLFAMRSTPHILVRGEGLVTHTLPGTKRLRVQPPPCDVEPGSVRVTEVSLTT
jgi:hypothetical protein